MKGVADCKINLRKLIKYIGNFFVMNFPRVQNADSLVKNPHDYKCFNSFSSFDKYGRFKQEKHGSSQSQENAKM